MKRYIAVVNGKLSDMMWFNVAFTMFMFYTIYEKTTFETFLGIPTAVFFKFCQAAILFCLSIKFATQKTTFPQWIGLIAFVFFGLVSRKITGNNWFMWMSLFVACSQNVKLQRLSRLSYIILAVMISITVGAAYVNIIPNIIVFRDDAMRSSLGFYYPNVLGYHTYALCVMYAVANYKCRLLQKVLLTLFCVWVNISVTGSRTAALMGVLLLVLIIGFDLINGSRTKHYLIVSFIAIFWLIPTISITLMVKAAEIPTQIVTLLDTALSGRISLAHGYYDQFGIRLFGQNFRNYPPLQWKNGIVENFVVDIAYAHLLLEFGLVGFLVVVIGFYFSTLELVRRSSWGPVLLGLLAMQMYSLSETAGLRIEFNIFLLIGGQIVFFSQYINVTTGLEATQNSIRWPRHRRHKYMRVRKGEATRIRRF